jgi:ribose transport system permease protein
MRLLERYGLVLVLAIAILGFSLWLPDTFPNVGNFKAMVDSQAIILLLALAATMPLRCGDFDLSISGVMTASGSLVAIQTSHGTSLALAFVYAVVLGVVVGGINGFLIVKLGVDSFVTTLGMMTALGGLSYAFTNNAVITDLPSSLLTLSRHEFFGLPTIVWLGWILVIVAWYVYERTPLGRYLLFVGGSRDAARLAGVRVDAVRIGSFVACSTLAAITGLLLAGSIGQMDPSIGPQYLLQPFAGVFLGATTIAVGRVNAFGTIVALYLLTVGITGLQLYGVDPWVSNVFNGGALMVAVAFARLAARSSGNR